MISVSIQSTSTINQPQTVLNGNSKGGNSGGSCAVQIKDHMGSSDEQDEYEDENEVEDEDNSPVVIDKSKMFC